MKKVLRASLDRIENDVAVFISDENETLNLNKSDIPLAKEGGVYELELDGNRLVRAEYLKDETEARLARAESRLRRLFKNR